MSDLPRCLRSTATTRLCAGPPATLPCTIRLPITTEEVTRRHRSGHTGYGSDSALKCPLCAATAKHLEQCPTCRAALITCFRDRCDAAWSPFVNIAGNVARAIEGRIFQRAPAFVEEARDEALYRALNAVLEHPDLAPENVIADPRPLRPWLRRVMWNRAQDVLSLAGAVREGVDILDDEGRSLVDSAASGFFTTGWEAENSDPALIVTQNDTRDVLYEIILRYRDGLNDVDRYIFDQWYVGQRDGEPRSQKAIAEGLLRDLNESHRQDGISKRITKFKTQLEKLFNSPDSQLDAETQALATALFLSGKNAPRRRRSAECADCSDVVQPAPLEGH